MTRDDPKWASAMASLTVRAKVKRKCHQSEEKVTSRRQHKDKENERDCKTVVQQLVFSIPQSVLMSTLY